MSQPIEHRVQIDMSAEAARGVYANFVSVWHDNDGFTLDFSAMVQPPAPGTDPQTGAQYLLNQAQVVARVRIPPSQVFEIMKALEQQLTAWELETGKGSNGPGGRKP